MTYTEPHRPDDLAATGVRWIDPRQTYVDRSVELARLRPGSTVFPGCRLCGAQTYLGPGSRIGTEGPVVLHDAVVGADVEIGSGFLDGAVLMAGARVGPNAYFRPVVVLEEQASTAHAVGLKQTILMSFVTLGSLINFCDGLVAGGRSRREHTEIGSGFIHFNFTPWGRSGDKATPSLVGDVPHGALLGSDRIFLGGLGGMVGPRQVGFGALTVAGTVVRRDVAANTMHGEPGPRLSRPLASGHQPASPAKRQANLAYLGQLAALQAWYRQVRIARAAQAGQADALCTAEAGAAALQLALRERWQRLADYAKAEAQAPLAPLERLAAVPAQPLDLTHRAEADHVGWVQGLSSDEAAAASAWLAGIAQATATALDGA